jgi:DNA-binding transcriptional MerR regulator
MHTPNGAVEVAKRVGISYRQMDYWLRTGVITIESDSSGSGSRRVFTPEEEAALKEMVDEMRQAEQVLERCRSGEVYHHELRMANVAARVRAAILEQRVVV